jgi:hypothetical protein
MASMALVRSARTVQDSFARFRFGIAFLSRKLYIEVNLVKNILVRLLVGNEGKAVVAEIKMMGLGCTSWRDPIETNGEGGPSS